MDLGEPKLEKEMYQRFYQLFTQRDGLSKPMHKSHSEYIGVLTSFWGNRHSRGLQLEMVQLSPGLDAEEQVESPGSASH